MDLEAPDLGGRARPGQFLQVRPIRGLDPLLPRPLSIHRARPEGVSLLYRAAGRGTRILSGLRGGEAIDVFGPLGNGFPLEPFAGRTFLLAGGIGIAPLLFLAEAGLACGALDAARTALVFGAATKADLVAAEDFAAAGVAVHTATDDGSSGFHGTALSLLLEKLSEEGVASRVFAVGPEAMYRDMASVLRGRTEKTYVSMERRMACGVGACRACVTAVREGAGRVWRDTCRSGPVFELESVCFDGMESNG